MIEAAKNGCNNLIKFQEKNVYFDSDSGIEKSSLGTKLDKISYLESKVDSSNLPAVSNLMTDWELYENGWFINSYDNKDLFYYLAQIGNYGFHRPKELDYFR